MIKDTIFITVSFVNFFGSILKQSFYAMSGANSIPAAQTASSFTQPKHARRRGQTNVQLVQNVLLIWLDNNIDQNSSDCQNTTTHLRGAVNSVNTFTDADECIRFLDDMGNEKTCMIISGALGQHIMPRVHDLSQIDSIFIICGNETFHDGWTKNWPKIKGVYTEIEPICDALKQAARQCEQNAVSISIMGPDDTLSNKSLNQPDPSFMYTQIMKEILLTIHFEQQHIDEFAQHCRRALDDNPNQLKYVDELVNTYREKTPIWWYTRECFLYPMLNRALRAIDAELIVKLGFFISDLHQQIQELHREEFGSAGYNQKFTVYRGQCMEKKEFDKTVASEGGLISFNCFLSTSRDPQVSLVFAKGALSNPQLVNVLFVMTIDPALRNTPFASVAKVGAIRDQEHEVVFSMNTVFRIGQIKQLGDNPRLFRVELSMTSEKDKDHRLLIDRIRDETFPDVDGWHRLGAVLWKMGEAAKAQRVFEVLLQQTTAERTRGVIYNQLGMMARDLGQYDEAIGYYEKAIRIEEKQSPRNHQNLASSYNNIGSVYYSMGDYPKALSSYEKALVIQQQSLPPTHPDLASSYNNIGLVYNRMGNYPKALSSHEKALAIKQQSLPPTHPDLASSYNNIGLVYNRMGNYRKALSSYEKALGIRQQSLPPTHPDLASSYNNVGLVYNSMGDYPKALSFYEKALAVRQESLPPTHPDLASSYNNIGLVYNRMGDYPKALSSNEKAMAIRQQSLPPTHPDLASSYNNIGLVYNRMSNYPKALSFYEKALAIKQQSLPPTHPDLASSYNNIGLVYNSMGDYPKALSSNEKAMAIRQQSLPPTHPDLASSYNNVGLVYNSVGDYPKALSFYEKALAVRQESLPPTHPDLASSYNNIGLVYNSMGDYPKALSSNEKALAVQQQSLPPTHPDLASSYNNMGLVHENMKNYSKAHSCYERAVDIAQSSFPPDHPEAQKWRNNLARIKKKL